MRLVGNIIWLVFGGLILALVYTIAGIINCIFIITIPFGLASFRLASYALWPFGRVVSGWVLNSAVAINMWGQIVGSGTRNGHIHGFLLTPSNPFLN